MKRTTARPPIRVRFREGKHFEAVYRRDIQHGGIFLKTDQLRPLRSSVRVVLAMPDGKELELTGEVVRVVSSEEVTPGNPMGMAVQFKTLPPDTKQQLETYLTELKRRTLVPGPSAQSELDDRRLLRRLVWLLAEGEVEKRAVEALFGLPRDAPPEARQAICERVRRLLVPDQPPEYLGWNEARAIIRLLTLLESRVG